MIETKPLIKCLVTAGVIVAMIAVCDCQAGKERLEQQEQIEQRLKVQEERLQDIEEIVSRKRQSIEEGYVYRLNKLQRWTEDRIKKVKIPDRVLWTEFLKAYHQISYTDSYIASGDHFK